VWRAPAGKEVGSDMNPYSMVTFGNGTPEATALSARLAAWHDAMVAHDRKIRAGRQEVCDDECPHAYARTLWDEALEVLGDRAHELTFLRSRAAVQASTSGEVVAPRDARSPAAAGGRRSNGSGHNAVGHRSKFFGSSSEQSRTASAGI
jgi:hypothetical protein